MKPKTTRPQEVRQLRAGALGLRPDGREQDEEVPAGVAVVHLPLHPRGGAGGPAPEDKREAAAVRELAFPGSAGLP